MQEYSSERTKDFSVVVTKLNLLYSFAIGIEDTCPACDKNIYKRQKR
jgi:hypothetical protein